MTSVCLVRLFTTKLNRMITIKELQLDNETALKLIKLIKKEEPEIWKVLKGELTEALNIQNVSKKTPILQQPTERWKAQTKWLLDDNHSF
jgi:hypothetical protein